MKLFAYLSIFTFLFATSYHISAMNRQYELPDAQTIIKRLWDNGFHHFCKKSEIGFVLGSQYYTPIILSSKVDTLLKTYSDNGPYVITTNMFLNKTYPKEPLTKDVLMRILLKDYPRAIESLELNYDGNFLR